ncbi:MAG: hypothetical protein BTN85_0540 [Candidatus Methanohalarchaeum thermophilum]|uniref:Uncharacterized protein n=1 Tax=Methanohalarchaeum thermophilum TaxID=1903181 RepID=A0A1Q6DUM8_METT1|nr:MAG: hypothetical protein BTN85_0540 [Candidatus Methanohalarchaeum thermophilum]
MNITKTKEKQLRREYESLQKYLHNGEDVELHYLTNNKPDDTLTRLKKTKSI